MMLSADSEMEMAVDPQLRAIFPYMIPVSRKFDMAMYFRLQDMFGVPASRMVCWDRKPHGVTVHILPQTRWISFFEGPACFRTETDAIAYKMLVWE